MDGTGDTCESLGHQLDQLLTSYQKEGGESSLSPIDNRTSAKEERDDPF
jgi:hypothetical protein